MQIWRNISSAISSCRVGPEPLPHTPIPTSPLPHGIALPPHREALPAQLRALRRQGGASLQRVPATLAPGCASYVVPSTGNRLPRDTAVHTETAVTSGRPCRACFSPGSLPGQPAAMLGGCSSSLWEPHLVRNGGLLPTRTLGCVLQPQQPPETLSPPPNSPSGIPAWTDGHSVGGPQWPPLRVLGAG